MILKMTDRTEMFVSPSEGDAIRRALTKSETGFITVRGVTLKKSAVLKLEEGGTDPKVSLFDKPKLELPAGCKGQHSITKELMRIAAKQKNFKLLADTKWREEQIAILRESGRKFCDAKTGTCACQPA